MDEREQKLYEGMNMGDIEDNEKAWDEGMCTIQRYKIGYHTDEWGMRSGTPAGIHDASGSWVRYSDHVAVIAALRAQHRCIEEIEVHLASAKAEKEEKK